MKNIVKRLKNIIYLCIILSTGFFSNQSCTQYETPPPIRADIPESGPSTSIRKKVLWINIDGAVGQVVKELCQKDKAPQIKKMLEHSKYSWTGLSDSRTLSEGHQSEDAANWSTLLTGVIPEKHTIFDGSYMPNVELDPTKPEQKVSYYPNVMDYIAEANPAYKTLCITPWTDLNTNMLSNAALTLTTKSDEETKTEALRYLEEEDYTFTLVSFSGMFHAAAGKSGGFSAGNTDYVAALTKIDSYIGEFLQAIQQRENSSLEDWLVVITSNHGGTEAGGYKGTSDAERNTFALFYFPYYTSLEMKGETMYGVYMDRYLGGVVRDPDGVYGLSAGKTLTLELVMRMNPKDDGTYGGNNWDKIIGKNRWGIFRQRNTASLRVEGASGVIEKGVDAFNDAWWHTYSAGIESFPRKRAYKIFYDGENKSSSSSDMVSDAAVDASDFTIGKTGVPTSFYVSEIRLWDNILEDQVMADNASRLNILSSDPDYSHLVGYWKFVPEAIDETGLIVKNQIEGKPELTLSLTSAADPMSTFIPVKFANTLPYYKKTGNLLVEHTLIAPQILYWLGVKIDSKLDGFAFLNNYSADEEWREYE